jgi:hypothetical protein
VGDTPLPALRGQCLTERGGTPRFLAWVIVTGWPELKARGVSRASRARLEKRRALNKWLFYGPGNTL